MVKLQKQIALKLTAAKPEIQNIAHARDLVTGHIELILLVMGWVQWHFCNRSEALSDCFVN